MNAEGWKILNNLERNANGAVTKKDQVFVEVLKLLNLKRKSD